MDITVREFDQIFAQFLKPDAKYAYINLYEYSTHISKLEEKLTLEGG